MPIKSSILKNIFILIIPLLGCYYTTLAQTDSTSNEEPFVKFINGSKHIYLNKLDFSPNMTILELLQLFPEMTTRGSNDVLNNYTIIMEDNSLGIIRDEILYQMTIGELKEIIICDNPSAAYDNNGVGGTIELIPKDLSNGLSGNVQLDVATLQDVLFSTNINHKKNNLVIRSFIKGEYYNFTDFTRHRSFFNSTLTLDHSNYINPVGGSELAKISVEYTPSSKDAISFSLWENFRMETQNSYEISHDLLVGYYFDTSRTRSVGTLAKFNYTHLFSPYHKIQYFANYSFSNQWNNYNISDFKYDISHQLSSGLQYIADFIHLEKHHLQMVTGLNFSYLKNLLGKPFKPQFNSTNINPLLEFRYTYSDKLYARIGGQYYCDIYQKIDMLNKIKEHDDYLISGEVNYTPKGGHTLRLSGIRDRLSMTNGEKTGDIVSGDISYILQKSIQKHFINFTVGLQYDNVNLLSNNEYNIYSFKLGLVWQYHWLCLSLSGHVFDNSTFRNDKSEDYHSYYNLRLMPIFTLPKGWSISADFMYNSKLITRLNVEGDYFFCSLRISKKINQWSVRADISDPFHYMTHNSNYTNGYGIFSDYYPYHRYINLGVSYNF